MQASPRPSADAPLQRPLLSAQEREAIDRSAWFASLPPSLRHDIFRLGHVTRLAHGDTIVEQGNPIHDWFACASGALRFRRTTSAGRRVTLAYVEPGIWVGEAEVLYGRPCTYDAHAHGSTTLLSVPEIALRSLLQQHPTFGQALLTLQARSMRSLYLMMEDVATLPLRARLAKQLLHLQERFGPRDLAAGESRPLGLSLAQDELAGLLGGSRQRVNVELKWLERHGLISVRPRGIELHDVQGLRTLVEQATAEDKPED
ncbi:MAG: Crp/Fnr family transcriptional regulator [Proteobacteria bacterium]|nr:Crp/Fnr family transcriptional regulator [Pseudomonadota bacterium]